MGDRDLCSGEGVFGRVGAAYFELVAVAWAGERAGSIHLGPGQGALGREGAGKVALGKWAYSGVE